MMRHLQLGALAIAFLAFAGSVSPAEACACVASAPPKGLSAEAEATWRRDALRSSVTAQFDRAVAVFSGEVIENDMERVRFKVDRVWKGRIPAELDMSTGMRQSPSGAISFSSCDYTFNTATKYMVFAFGASMQTMTASNCTQTAELSRASETVEVLDALVKERAKALERLKRDR